MPLAFAPDEEETSAFSSSSSSSSESKSRPVYVDDEEDEAEGSKAAAAKLAAAQKATASGKGTDTASSSPKAVAAKPAGEDDEDISGDEEDDVQVAPSKTSANSGSNVGSSSRRSHRGSFAASSSSGSSRSYWRLAIFQFISQVASVFLQWPLMFLALLLLVRMFGLAFEGLIMTLVKILAVVAVVNGCTEIAWVALDWVTGGYAGIGWYMIGALRFAAFWICSAALLELEYVEVSMFSFLSFVVSCGVAIAILAVLTSLF